MVQISVLYPNKPGSRFDEAYYRDTHMPLLQELWGPMGLTDAKVLRGLGAPDGGAAPFRVVTLLTFASADAFDQAVRTHGGRIFGDIPNFTDAPPVAQLNEAF